jgi:hypothetical protein
MNSPNFKSSKVGPNHYVSQQALQQALGLLKQLGYPACEEILPRLHGSDPFEDELVVMAEVSAYFHVSYKV